MSLFVVLKYLCTHNSSFPLFFDGFLLENNTTLSDNYIPNATESCNEITYEFDISGSDPPDAWTPPFMMCQQQQFALDDPLFSQLLEDIVSPSMLVCASTDTNATCEASSSNFCTPCDPGTYGSALDTCSECTPGFHRPDPGGTACMACDPGEYSQSNGTAECSHCSPGTYAPAPASTTCETCIEGANFSSATASTACTQCSTTCPPGKTLQGACTPENDIFCSDCPPVANCVYTQQGSCGNGSAPNCDCIPGFEMVEGQCEACLPGYFKNQTDPYPCIQWDSSDTCPPTHFAINGTRFTNSACVPCPDVPENASFVVNSSSPCKWICDAGFNNTLNF